MRGRGPVCRKDGIFQRMSVEVLGDWLQIRGAGPGNLRRMLEREDFAHHRGRIYGEEYSYDLDREAAEALLAALEKDFGQERTPEQIILDEFEFAHPRQTLHSYLEERGIPHQYAWDQMFWY